MMDKTNWREGSHGSKRLSFSSDIHNWIAWTMMYQRDPAASEYSRRCSPTLPHLSCFVYDDEMIRDDGSLSHAELTTIMVLAVQQVHYRIYRHAAVIPIVVFSCSGRQVRIVQGCIDFRHYHFDVRCSEILDFNEGGIRGTDENLRRFYTLLGWVLGEPVGNIEKYQCDVGRH